MAGQVTRVSTDRSVVTDHFRMPEVARHISASYYGSMQNDGLHGLHQCAYDRFRLARLGNETRSARSHRQAGLKVAGCDHDGNPRPGLPDMAEQRQSVSFPGHPHIRVDDVELSSRCQDEQCLVPIGRFTDGVSGVPQMVGYVEPDKKFILHHKNAGKV